MNKTQFNVAMAEVRGAAEFQALPADRRAALLRRLGWVLEMDRADNRDACAKGISRRYKGDGTPASERRGTAVKSIDYWWRRWGDQDRDWRVLDGYRALRGPSANELETYNITPRSARDFFLRARVSAAQWGAKYGFVKQAISRALHGTPGKRSQEIFDQLAADIRGEPQKWHRELVALRSETERLSAEVKRLEAQIPR